MNLFQKLVKKGVTCDICGSEMIPEYGACFDHDVIACTDKWMCGAEITFPTSTECDDEAEIELRVLSPEDMWDCDL